jgi:P27 family predicted phage terminase small subunit
MTTMLSTDETPTRRRRAAIAELLTADPARSDRATAKLAGCDHKTVGSVRREMAAGRPGNRVEDAGRKPPGRRVVRRVGKKPSTSPLADEGEWPAPPTHLSPDAAAIWRETVGLLEARGTLNREDAMTLETYCMAVIRQRRLTVELEAHPLVVDGKLSPLLRVAEATAATVKNLGHVLGLNPVARQRMPGGGGTRQPDPSSKWRGILR